MSVRRGGRFTDTLRAMDARTRQTPHDAGRGTSGQAAQRASTMVVSDGGLPSLVACGIQREMAAQTLAERGFSPSVLVMPWIIDAPARESRAKRLRAVMLQVEAFGFQIADEGEARGGSESELESNALLHATFVAARRGCASLTWPVQCVRPEVALGGGDGGLDLDWIARCSDRALLVSRLVSIDAHEHASPSIRIETPCIDLTDAQVADLALDMELPIQACWWWGDDGHPEAMRWTRALRSVGWTAPSSV